jgi:hypothetical protein
MAKTTTTSTGNQVEPGDDNGGIAGVPGADDPAGDDRGMAMQPEPGDDKGVVAGADDPPGDNHGAAPGADDPAGHHHFSFTDTTTHASGGDDGAAYTGPVTYLQNEYGWTGHDGRAVTANVGSAFVHGGDGDDAIAAVSGDNVLDGGGGSNFLVGAKGDDGGKDVFFVDLRNGGTVWDTVVNFHGGDAVTIWGFNPGVSTVSWTDNDGVDGFRGATMHAEIHGLGTGVDASVTFAGLSVAQAQSRLSSSTGNVGGNDYLYMHNDG